MKIAVITGASAGIGRELVLAVDKAKDLDEIWVIARRRERLEELKTLCRTKIRPIPLDLTRNTSIEEYRAFLIMEK
ncbi:MAG: SDR family NAD(P)-dependent oxidoreductase, partial [Firmicutes bacterium]|nr:SDR family NAD(P)-dependent oxidoreductase [Bacillota bacterium]